MIAKAPFGAADTAVVTVAGPAASTLVLIPETATVEAGESQQFSAYGRTSAGDSVPVSSTFEATGGTISTAGDYAAGRTAGTYRVVARTSAGLADTAAVTVTESPVTDMFVTPSSVTLEAGATKQFRSYGRNALGDSVDTPGTWTATGGDVSGDGLYTAGDVAGDYEVKVTATGTTVSATASVTNPGRSGGGTGRAGIPMDCSG